MTEFIKKARNGLIPQPTQKSFDLTIWDDAFLRINEPTTEDIRLHEIKRVYTNPQKNKQGSTWRGEQLVEFGRGITTHSKVSIL